jgi:hypothetical protein
MEPEQLMSENNKGWGIGDSFKEFSGLLLKKSP